MRHLIHDRIGLQLHFFGAGTGKPSPRATTAAPKASDIIKQTLAAEPNYAGTQAAIVRRPQTCSCGQKGNVKRRMRNEHISRVFPIRYFQPLQAQPAEPGRLPGLRPPTRPRGRTRRSGRSRCGAGWPGSPPRCRAAVPGPGAGLPMNKG
jgi:hypothetical protein